ncbi:MAG TPA: DUF2520 domain-containing protein [Candidatus Polarisedimenticolaceae bacterium]|nr:DUF2520 domain-containing protein [Candidatus Polarisedimenticolaceae bacterium]
MIAILGAGALARAVAPKLAPAVVWSRDPKDAKAIARSNKRLRAVRDLTAAVRDAEIVLLAVPDAAVGPLAARLARLRRTWSGIVVLHAAGALGPEPLAPLEAAGASTGVLHPLAVLGTRGAKIAGAAARIEGGAEARAAARRLAKNLGLRPLPTGKGLDRPAYHAAASLASNDVVALLLAARALLVRAGVAEAAAARGVVALAESALAVARRHGIEGALSGPAFRGDAATVAAHLRVLGMSDRETAAAHRALSKTLTALGRGRRRRLTV